jgi:hypothetical protein
MEYELVEMVNPLNQTVKERVCVKAARVALAAPESDDPSAKAQTLGLIP